MNFTLEKLITLPIFFLLLIMSCSCFHFWKQTLHRMEAYEKLHENIRISTLILKQAFKKNKNAENLFFIKKIKGKNISALYYKEGNPK